MTIAKISDRAAGYGMPGVTVDGNDVLAVYESARQAVLRAHRGEGPSLVEAVTYRWRGHSKSDANRYRTKEEIEEWKARCPIQRFNAFLVEQGVMAAPEVEAIRENAYRAISEAVTFAETCAEPALETIEEGVYA